MKNVRFLTFALALSLGACCHYKDDLSALDGKMAAQSTQTAMVATSPADISPAAGAPATSTLPQDLAREYYTLAKFENDKAYDYKASAFYTKQAMASAQGKMVVPSKVSAYDIPDDIKPELTSARKQLIDALKGENTPENATTLAKAQTRYECWLERAEEADSAEHYESCKSEFQAAMAALTIPAAGDVTAPTVYDVMFGADTSIIDPVSVTTVELVAQFLNDPKNEGYTANITGYGTGTTGDLSAARVGELRDVLVKHGVSEAKLHPLVAPVGVETTNKVQVALIAPEATVEGVKTTTFTPVTPHTVDTIPQGALVVPAPAPATVYPAPTVMAPTAPARTN